MVNYQISAKGSAQVQGIGVNLSAEFDKGKHPERISANCGGSIENGIYMNATATYDVATDNFLSLNGNNIPDGFIGQLKEKIIEFYNEIKQGNETDD